MTFDFSPRLAAIPLIFSLALGGCGTSGDDDGGGSTEDTVSGTARAPAGAVAAFEPRTTLLATLDFLMGPAAAAITGLEPVTGATVELVRVDDDGNQVGAVLATAATSITGNYSLRLPAGVSLAGNLIVRITGNGGAQMRAQVVERAIDISPVSEFVLRKFIADGTALGSLQSASVVRLTGQVEEFDLTATADLDSMLASLEAQTGAFVDSQIDVIGSTPGSAAAVAGQYRSLFIDWGLHDDDQQYGVGTVSNDLETAQLTLVDNGGGEVGFTLEAAESAYTNQTTVSAATELYFFVEIETEAESGTASLDEAGVLSIQNAFEEDIDEEFGWREPPSLVRLQKAPNANLFFAAEASASVRYRTVDTDGDDVKDAVDPAQREGDEAFRGLSLLAQVPSAASSSDLDGAFGRVFLAAGYDANGGTEVETESNVLTFTGSNATVDMAAAPYRRLTRNGYVAGTTPAEAGVAFTLAADGDLETLGGEQVDGFVSAGFDFLVVAGADSVDDAEPNDERVAEASFETTLAVKLPEAMLDLANRSYRMVFVGLSLDGGATAVAGSRFDSVLTLANDGLAGSLTAQLLDIEKATLTGEVTGDSDDAPVTTSVSVTLAGNGASTVTVDDTEGTATWQGYFNHDGSVGVFTSRYADTGQNDPGELGLVILVQI